MAAGNPLLAANTSSKEIHTLQTSKNPILKDIQGQDSFPDFAEAKSRLQDANYSPPAKAFK